MNPAGADLQELRAAAFTWLSTEAAVLDEDGTIVLVNEAWVEFGRRNGATVRCGVGSNYLSVCADAAAAGDALAGVAGAALQALLQGHAPRAALDYPCHSPTTERWFHLTAHVIPDQPYALVAHEEISTHVHERSRLQHAATHDPLTGLANRTLLVDRLGSALSVADKRREVQVAVIVVDLDDFKAVNDTHGHLAGDALLSVLGRRLQAVGRAWDTVARWGGDEFVLVLPGCTPAAAERIRRQVEEAVSAPVELGVSSVTVTATTGLAFGARDDDLTDLLAEADRSLLLAKRRRPGTCGEPRQDRPPG